MSSTLQLYSALSTFPGPALTWYASQKDATATLVRQELGAAVVSRWLAKISNLLGTDLADLFGGPDVPRSILLDMPGTWQEIMWTLSASAMGWEIHFADEEHAPECDVLVSNNMATYSDSLINAFLSVGADVLLHDTAPLALSWRGDLPAGVIDALGAIMSQPDSLIVDLFHEPSPIPRRSSWASSDLTEDKVAVQQHIEATPSSRVLLAGPIHDLPTRVRNLWEIGASVVVIAQEIDESERSRIFNAENCTDFLSK